MSDSAETQLESALSEVRRLRKALEFIVKAEASSPKYWADLGPGLQRVASAALETS